MSLLFALLSTHPMSTLNPKHIMSSRHSHSGLSSHPATQPRWAPSPDPVADHDYMTHPRRSWQPLRRLYFGSVRDTEEPVKTSSLNIASSLHNNRNSNKGKFKPQNILLCNRFCCFRKTNQCKSGTLCPEDRCQQTSFAFYSGLDTMLCKCLAATPQLSEKLRSSITVFPD